MSHEITDFGRAFASLKDDMLFGVATSSYQIEGSAFGNCGSSHWDDFAKIEGAITGGHDGAVACDHYHLYESDLDLIADAGFDAYRFSFSWPRLLPEAHNQINPDGLSFYDRLIDGMLARGLSPFATLYHWDLPSRLADKQGWRHRDTAHYFADYTDIIMRHFGDRLTTIAPINEPWCVSWLSHYWGHHAPGLRDLDATAKAMHYVQLAHGLSIQVMRESGHHNLGCVLNKEYAVPVDDSAEAMAAADLFDATYSRWFEESIFKGQYPASVLSVFEPYMPRGFEEDLKLIQQPLDWAGVNYYTRSVVSPDPTEPHFGFACGRGDLPKTDMGWEIEPEGLRFFLERLHKDYCQDLPIYITENGMAHAEEWQGDTCCDEARISYFACHLAAVSQARDAGVNIKGYFAWSLLDNFEWAFGYDKRFGLVYVDYETQKRTPKASYHAWRDALLTHHSQ